MRQLVYVSAAIGQLDPREVDAILQSARRNNPAQSVTGLLLCIDSGFLQVLEGPASGVEQIYRRILNDRRHTGQRVLFDEPVEARSFAQWSMGFDRPDPKRASDADVFRATRSAIEAAIPKNEAAALTQLVRTFYAINGGRDFG
jgi:hypothetical protein